MEPLVGTTLSPQQLAAMGPGTPVVSQNVSAVAPKVGQTLSPDQLIALQKNSSATPVPFLNSNATDAANAAKDYGEGLLNTYGTIPDDFYNDIKTGADNINAGQKQGGVKGFAKTLLGVGESAVLPMATAIKAIFAPITQGIGQFVNYAAGKESDSSTVQAVATSPFGDKIQEGQDLVQKITDQYPEATKDIGALVNVITAVVGEQPAEAGFNAAKQGASSAANAVADTASGAVDAVNGVANTVNEGLNKVGIGRSLSSITPEMQQQAVQDLADAYRENSGVKSQKIDMRAGARGMNSPDLLATHNIVPDIVNGDTITTINNPATGYENAGGTKIQTVIDKYNNALRTNLEEVVDPTGKTVDLEAERQAALKRAGNVQGTNATARLALKDSINQEFDSQIAEKGQFVKPSVAQDIKVENYGATKFDSAKPWQNTANGIVGSTMKTAIENVVGDSFPVADLNAELGKWYEAQKYYESLNGKKVLGGRLGNYIAKTAGTIIGSKIPIPGASLAGYFLGGKIEDFFADRTFTNAYKQAVLNSMKTEDPVAYTEAIQAIENEARARELRPKLPAGSPLGSDKNPIIPPAPTTYEASAERINIQDKRPDQLALPGVNLKKGEIPQNGTTIYLKGGSTIEAPAQVVNMINSEVGKTIFDMMSKAQQEELINKFINEPYISPENLPVIKGGKTINLKSKLPIIK